MPSSRRGCDIGSSWCWCGVEASASHDTWEKIGTLARKKRVWKLPKSDSKSNGFYNVTVYIYTVSSFSFGWFWISHDFTIFDHVWLPYTRIWPHFLAQKLQLWSCGQIAGSFPAFFGRHVWAAQTWVFFAPNREGTNTEHLDGTNGQVHP